MELWWHWPNDCVDGSVDCLMDVDCRLGREDAFSLETPNEKEADTQKSVQIQNLLIYYSPFKEPFSNVLSERLGAFFAQLFFGGVSIWNLIPLHQKQSQPNNLRRAISISICVFVLGNANVLKHLI